MELDTPGKSVRIWGDYLPDPIHAHCTCQLLHPIVSARRLFQRAQSPFTGAALYVARMGPLCHRWVMTGTSTVDIWSALFANSQFQHIVSKQFRRVEISGSL
eukprot:scaffold191591_cov15-Tisochrysis_lutea.AAC.1